MSYTPVELRHVRVGRSLFGYNRSMVEQLIEEVAHSFEATWRERGELAEKVEALEKQVEEHRQRENLLTQTLLAAEQAASDVKERARKEAETIVLEAHSESRAIVRNAQNQREQLMSEARRIEALLRAALGNVEEGTSQGAAELTSAPEQPALAPLPLSSLSPSAEKHLPPPQEEMPGWPREDTDEFTPPTQQDAPDAQQAQPRPEGEVPQGRQSVNPPEPILERVSGAGSAGFDWGE
jgi:cell division initiation protein